MAKNIVVEIPRNAVPSIPHDAGFSRNIYNAILEVETTKSPVDVPVGKHKVFVYIKE